MVLLSFFRVCNFYVGVFSLRKSSSIFIHLVVLFQSPSICLLIFSFLFLCRVFFLLTFAPCWCSHLSEIGLCSCVGSKLNLYLPGHPTETALVTLRQSFLFGEGSSPQNADHFSNECWQNHIWMLLTEILSTNFFTISGEVRELGETEESLIKRVRLTERG